MNKNTAYANYAVFFWLFAQKCLPLPLIENIT